MPIENEFKFVLEGVDALVAELRHLRPSLIRQDYMTPNARVREIRRVGHPPDHVFTFKIDSLGDLLEIEKEIDEADYRLAARATSDGLLKARFKAPGSPGAWDVDFLLVRDLAFDAEGRLPITEADVYFPMAEVEVPKGTLYGMLGPLSGHVLYEVPQEDNPYFSNERLRDRAYAARALAAIKAGERFRG